MDNQELLAKLLTFDQLHIVVIKKVMETETQLYY